MTERCAERCIDCRYDSSRIYGESLRNPKSDGWNLIRGMSTFGIVFVSVFVISKFISLCVYTRADLSASDYVCQRSQDHEKGKSSRTLQSSAKNIFTIIGRIYKTFAQQSQAFHFDLSVVLIS